MIGFLRGVRLYLRDVMVVLRNPKIIFVPLAYGSVVFATFIFMIMLARLVFISIAGLGCPLRTVADLQMMSGLHLLILGILGTIIAIPMIVFVMHFSLMYAYLANQALKGKGISLVWAFKVAGTKLGVYARTLLLYGAFMASAMLMYFGVIEICQRLGLSGLPTFVVVLQAIGIFVFYFIHCLFLFCNVPVVALDGWKAREVLARMVRFAYGTFFAMLGGMLSAYLLAIAGVLGFMMPVSQKMVQPGAEVTKNVALVALKQLGPLAVIIGIGIVLVLSVVLTASTVFTVDLYREHRKERGEPDV